MMKILRHEKDNYKIEDSIFKNVKKSFQTKERNSDTTIKDKINFLD